ncbi:MAG: hypothetical protein AAFQ66_08815 [Pseudomonadota bacterium]
MAIRLDVTGFFYRREIDFDASFQTVKQVMEAARQLGGAPSLDFTGETSSVVVGGTLTEVEFIKTISVTHAGGSAVSGQQRTGIAARRYANGVYLGQDDTVFFPGGDVTQGLVSPEGKKIVNAWQYYVYQPVDIDGQTMLVDVNRSMGPRRVEPYSQPFLSNPAGGARGILDEDVIVWRQVSIAISPTFPSSPDEGVGV